MAAAVISLVAIAVATALTVEGQKQQAEAARAAAQARAKAAKEAGISQERALRKANKLELSAQRLRLGRSGVQVTGSPLEVLASNAAEFEREAIELRLESGRLTALELLNARNAKRAGELAVAATAVRGAGQSVSSLSSSFQASQSSEAA